MRLHRALEDKKMDVRLRDKMVHEGELGKKEVQDYYSELPDDASNATTTQEVEEKRRQQIAQNQ